VEARAHDGQLQEQVIELRAVPRAPDPAVEGAAGQTERNQDEPHLPADDVRPRHDHPGRQRQLRVKAAVELGERRDHLDDNDADEGHREADQDDGVNHRGDRPRTDRIDGFRIRHEPPQNRVEVAGALARHQRRGVDARKQLAVERERLGERRTRAYLFVHVIQHGLEQGVREPGLQDVKRLHQRHAGLQQRGQFLVEHQELVPLDLPGAAEREAAQANAGLE
jgi:hypothetical protein